LLYAQLTASAAADHLDASRRWIHIWLLQRRAADRAVAPSPGPQWIHIWPLQRRAADRAVAPSPGPQWIPVTRRQGETKIRQRRKSLIDEIGRAAGSSALHVSEARWRAGLDRADLFRRAARRWGGQRVHHGASHRTRARLHHRG
jgi:hypothetical protein